MKHIKKLVCTFVMTSILEVALTHAGDLTVVGNLIVPNGQVGIGTGTDPHAPLEIQSGFDTEVLRFGHSAADYHFLSTGFHGSQPQLNYLGFNVEHSSGDIRPVMTLVGNGNVGIGTTSPQAALDVNGDVITSPNDHGSPGNIVLTAGSVDGTALYCHSYGVPFHAYNDYNNNDVYLAGGMAGTFTAPMGAVLQLLNSGGDPNPQNSTQGTINFGDPGTQGKITYGTDTGFAFWVNGAIQMNVLKGVVSVPVLQINGADLAEPFEVSSQSLQKGSIVVIDENCPGKVKQSNHAYDKRVAGILSGANGVHPGIRLKQDGFNDQGEEVALSGRVYALADAANGVIKPGDLLTTSDTPGHCMKVTDPTRAQGAIIGKAMSSLESGQGMVLVLVSLQ